MTTVFKDIASMDPTNLTNEDLYIVVSKERVVGDVAVSEWPHAPKTSTANDTYLFKSTQ